MCSVDTPEPVEIERPTFVRNPFLDEVREDVAGADAARRGRSSLVIGSGTGIGFDGRGGTSGVANAGNPNGNSRNPGGRRGGGISIPRGTGSAGGGTGGQGRARSRQLDSR